ncbi:MAG: peptide ABC transporter substrate-binding protein [Treponema sp.]|nr:peptide ABC transporter substrate-binding protein [Treponema sp.]
MKKILFFAFIVMMVFVIAGCVRSQDVEEGAKTFTFIRGGDPVTLDRGRSVDNMSAIALYYSQTQLFRPIGDVLEPDGALSMDVSQDGMTITFNLRPGLVWADGQPLTAHHYAYAFLKILEPESANAGANVFYPIRGAEEFNMGRGRKEDVAVLVPNDLTLTIQLSRPSPTIYSSLQTMTPIRPDIAESFGISYGSSPETFLSSGPYILSAWDYDQSITFTKNPLFWNASNVHITELRWLTFSDPTAQRNFFDAGEADYYQPRDVGVWERYAHSQKGAYPQSGGNFLQFNFSNASNPQASRILANRNFRMALSYSINRQPLINATNPGYAADTRLIQPGTPSVRGNWGDAYQNIVTPATADPARARQFMDVALRELGIASASDLPEFSFLFFDVPTYRAYAEHFIDAWESILGITSVSLTILPVPQAIQRAMSGQFDMYIAGLTRTEDPFTFYELLSVGGAANWGAWERMHEFTDMLMATNYIVDPRERQDALFQCELFFDQHGFIIPLWSYGSIYVISDSSQMTGYLFSTFNNPESQFLYANIAYDSERR